MEDRVAITDRKTLLIIDDDTEWTDLLNVFFSDKYNVWIANSAQDAISVIGSRTPGAIILDLVMPSVDGFGLMQRLNAMFPVRIPTVLTTGWNSPDVESCAASMGCAAVLAKPVSLPELDRVVGSLLDGSFTQTSAKRNPPPSTT